VKSGDLIRLIRKDENVIQYLVVFKELKMDSYHRLNPDSIGMVINPEGKMVKHPFIQVLFSEGIYWVDERDIEVIQ
jgi:hypothetical protein